MPPQTRIRRTCLRVPDLDGLSAFYGDLLGLYVVEGPGHLCVSVGPDCADLEFRLAEVAPHDPQPDDFYWKIGLTLGNLDAAVAHLHRNGVAVPAPRQFRDIGYMSRLVDPRGFQIELLQQGFEGRATPAPAGHPIAAQATLAHITLRVADMAPARQLFGERLGMRLMSVQPVRDHGFDLYFYGWSDEVLPDSDLEAVANREWLWARPYTLIELQHLREKPVRTPVMTQAGFDGFSYGDGQSETQVGMDQLRVLLP